MTPLDPQDPFQKLIDEAQQETIDYLKWRLKQSETKKRDGTKEQYQSTAPEGCSTSHALGIGNPDPYRCPPEYDAENTTKKENTFRRKLAELWREPKTYIELAAILAAGILALLNWQVLCEMQKQTPMMAESAGAAIKAAKAAQDTLVISRQQLVGTQAAVIKIDGPSITGGEISMAIRNVGHVHATGVSGALATFIKTLPRGRETRFKAKTVPPRVIPDGGVDSVAIELPLRDLEAAIPWESSTTIILRGNFVYNNGFGDWITIGPLCYQYLPMHTPVPANDNRSILNVGGDLIRCDDWQRQVDLVRYLERIPRQ